MLKIGAQLEIERVHRERKRQKQGIAQACYGAAHREKKQKQKEERLKRQHEPENVRCVKAGTPVHKRGERRAKEEAERAAQREQSAERGVAVAERAEIYGGKAARNTESHPEARLIERVKRRELFPHALTSRCTSSIIHKGHGGVKPRRVLRNIQIT